MLSCKSRSIVSCLVRLRKESRVPVYRACSARLMSDNEHGTGNDLRELQRLQSALSKLRESVERYGKENPHVANVSKLDRRVKREIAFVAELIDSVKSSYESVTCSDANELVALEDLRLSDEPASSTGGEPILTNIQGLRNNLRGIAAELATASEAPDVVALNKSFHSRWPGTAPDDESFEEGTEGQQQKVEVDVVAQRGHLWIEVKDQGSCGIESTRWLGSKGRSVGIEAQALARLQAAKAPWNQLLWTPPSVLFYFPSGVGEDVAECLVKLGVHVVAPGPLQAASLPPVPSPPSRCNLDVTTLCGLVSEVSHAVGSPEVQAWAAPVSHWQECVAAEEREPLLAQLNPHLEGRELYAVKATVTQFEKLLADFGGPKERDRWNGLLSRLQIIPDSDARSELVERAAGNLPSAQTLVFSAGDALHALTFTANARAVAGLRSRGAQIPVHIHRPVWLTGQ